MRLNARLLFTLLVLLFSTAAQAGPPPSPHANVIKCGTHQAITSQRHLHSRPDLPLSKVSADDRFMVHYSDTGLDSTSETFVDSALSILTQMWELQVNQLGYLAPVVEEDDRIHLYLKELGYIYGQSIPLYSSGVEVPGYMVIDNDFQNSSYPTRGLNGLRVTIAHEFFHLVQFAYRYEPGQIAAYEWCSVWMEDVAYDPIDDYLWYLYDFFERPDISLLRMDGRHEYASTLFIHLVDQAWGPDLVRETWEQFGLHGERLFDQILLTLSEAGISRREVATQFMLWSLYTGSRAVPGFGFEEASDYDTLALTDLGTGGEWEDYVGEWGFRTFVFPGGVQGSPDFQVSPANLAEGVFTVEKAGEVNWTLAGENTSMNGTPAHAAVLSLRPSGGTVSLNAYPDNPSLPQVITLYPAWPNPFNTSTSIAFSLDLEDSYRVQVFNLLGQEVYRSVGSSLPGVMNRVTWPGVSNGGTPLPTAFYIIRVSSRHTQAVGRVLLLR